MKRIINAMLIFGLWLGAASNAFAVEPIYSDFFGKAIKGYDPVSYFIQAKAIKGQGKYSYQWNGAEWNFSSQANLERFVNNPVKYAPQYGGYCAWAVSSGYTAKIDPKAWSIVEGKLYLNYSKSVRSQWAQDKIGNIAKGNANWPTLLAQ